MGKHPENLIWIDLEMTGLKPDEDHIIEIATIVTDKQLRLLAEGPVLAIHQDDLLLNNMDDWNTRTHGRSGLIKRVQESKITEAEAQRRTISFLSKHVDEGLSPMCGSSICQDRRFLARYMPELEAYFHYRNVDVSSLKELAKRWAPDVARAFEKEGSHRALDDIRESIRELQHYRKHLFQPFVQLIESSDNF